MFEEFWPIFQLCFLEFGTNQGSIKTITRVHLKREASNRNAFLYLIGPLIELSRSWFAQLLSYDIPVDILRGKLVDHG